MGILKDIWNTIFGKSKKQEEFGRGGSIEDPKMEVVHKKESSKIVGGYTSGDIKPDNSKTCHYQHTNNFCQPNFTPSNHGVCNFPVTPDKVEAGSTCTENELLEFDSENLKSKENKIDSQIKFEVSEPKAKRPYKERVKGMIMTKEQEVLQYLLKYGSIDKRTCAEKFGLKRLDNVICELRKQGMNIKNEKVEIHNEIGEKIKVNNYRLVPSDGTN
jgi:hypothetical protein